MIEIPAPVDMHCHFRQPEEWLYTVPPTVSVFEYALAMPNTKPPISDWRQREEYLDGLSNEGLKSNQAFKPLMAMKLTPETPLEEILSCHGQLIWKLYPEGVTTNSEGSGWTRKHFELGSPESRILEEKLKALEQSDSVLCIHGEMPGSFCLNREDDFLYYLHWMVEEYSKLRFVLEHITTLTAVDFVERHSNVAATITLHHLLDTLDDVIGKNLNPHKFCKPIPKMRADREALRQIVKKCHHRFFLGSDSAPHSKVAKEECGCAGCFTSPGLVERLYTLFEKVLVGSREAKHLLTNFACHNGRKWYRLPISSYSIRLKEEEWTVPNLAGPYKPYLAGEKLLYKAEIVQ